MTVSWNSQSSGVPFALQSSSHSSGTPLPLQSTGSAATGAPAPSTATTGAPASSAAATGAPAPSTAGTGTGAPVSAPRPHSTYEKASAGMILTVTPNPSLDRTYEVPALDRGEVIRATGDRMDPGGKGVNVSRAVAAAGRRTLAVLPLGGAPGDLVAELLREQGIEVAPVAVAGQTRSNISLAEPDGALTKVNAAGPELSADESEALLATVRDRSAGAAWIACSRWAGFATGR